MKKYCCKRCACDGERELNRLRQQKCRLLKNIRRREAIQKAYERNGKIMDTQHVGKGTGKLGSHPDPDPKKELEKIRKERKYLKLKS